VRRGDTLISSIWEEARMKIGSYVFAVVAFGALTMNIAVAAHHGHRASAAASESKPNAPSAVKSPAPTDDQQGVSDRANGNVAAPAPDTGGKRDDAGAPIDTSITVNQGRQPVDRKGRSLLPKTKAAATPGLAIKQLGHDLHHAAPAFEPGAIAHRNAVGAIVGHDKTAAHPAAGQGVARAQGAATPQHTGVALHEPNTKLVTEPVKTPSPGAAEGGERTATALKVVTSNGLGISGTGVTRPGLAAGALGGPAKTATGVLSGNSFRSRHP
jgi:hypothetical protein